MKKIYYEYYIDTAKWKPELKITKHEWDSNCCYVDWKYIEEGFNVVKFDRESEGCNDYIERYPLRIHFTTEKQLTADEIDKILRGSFRKQLERYEADLTDEYNNALAAIKKKGIK